MTSLNAQNITLAVIFILRFKKENYQQTGEFLITNDLKKIQWENLHDTFRTNMDFYLLRFKEYEYELERDDLALKSIQNCHKSRLYVSRNHRCNCLICFGIENKTRFQNIDIPVSKKLFLKAISFSAYQDVILSTREIYDMAYNLFMLLDNTSIMASVLLKQLLADETLFEKLELLHRENVQAVMNNYRGPAESRNAEAMNQKHVLYAIIMNIKRIVEEEFVFIYKDRNNNMALTASKMNEKKKPPFIVDICVEDLWRPFSYFKLDCNFIIHNSVLLEELLQRNGALQSPITLDIDFTTFSQRLAFVANPNQGVQVQRKLLAILQIDIFEHVSVLKLRLSDMVCQIDFRFLLDTKVVLHCNNITFARQTHLPRNLKDIYIQNSNIQHSLILPDSTNTVFLKGVVMSKRAKLVINSECLNITIEETVGAITIPTTFNVDAFSFNNEWKRCHIRKNSSGTIKELAIVGAGLHENWLMEEGIKKAYLERITATVPNEVIINSECEDLTLKNCTGRYDFLGNLWLNELQLVSLMKSFELYLTKKNNRHRLRIVNMNSVLFLSLNEKIKIIEFENVSIPTNAVFSIHIGCQNISLKNCRGSFDCFFGLDKKRVRVYKPTNYFSLQFNENTGKYKMSFIKMDIDVSWVLWDKLDGLHLESFTNNAEGHFEIQMDCSKIKLVNCKGLFKIPGVLIENQDALRLNIPRNEFHLTKLQDSSFLLHMSDIILSKTISILHNIRCGRLERVSSSNNVKIKFESRCEILLLKNCEVSIDMLTTNIYERLILSRMFEVHCILESETRELFINNCKIVKDVILCKTLYKLDVHDVEVFRKNTITIPKQCMNVMMRICFGTFLISVLNEYEGQERMFFQKFGNFYFFSYQSNNHYLLKIENCELDRNISIRKDIKDVILSNITFTSKSPSQRVEGKALFSSESLLSLTLKFCPFLYNATIHRILRNLHLEGLCFNHDVRIGPSVQNLVIRATTINKNSSLLLGKNIMYLDIYSFNGVLNFNGFLSFEQLRLWGDEKIVYESELQSRKNHLKLENLTLSSDYQLPTDITSLYLTGIKTKNNSKISVNKACEKVIANFKGKIYFMEQQNTVKATFVNFLPIFETSCWTFSASRNIRKTKTPNHLKSIGFEDIKSKSTIITINEGCEDISIVHCLCEFDLLKVKKLVKFKLHIMPFTMVFLSFPILSYIEELDLAFNFMIDFFEYLLCNCFNVRILTLRALSLNPNNSHWRKFLSSVSESAFSFTQSHRLKEARKLLNRNLSSEKNINKTWILFNRRMNMLIAPGFNTKSEFKLETLKIVGFYLTNKNLACLSSFGVLRKLSVDYNFVSAELFEHLPLNIETLEILSSDVLAPNDKNSMDNLKNAKSMKKTKGVERLVMEGAFFKSPENFFNLPQDLHSLRISYHNLVGITYEPSIEKIHLRELCVFFRFTINEKRRFALTSIERKICVQEMLRFLSDFIDFSRLESLVVEDRNEKINYDPFEIY